ncbi:hypothetical protein FSP39_016631 [Pinctada imbricata]|uniref:NADAR domain-containing protein n=1 Tax=Pinctada imbricata TaxID=66713 RepID=A0AA89BR65_PINIB|nr:hypothetical protein FSP39_016631 [Pinctada imbricata]
MDGQGQTLQNDLNGNHGHHPNGESSISQDGNDWHDHSGGRVKGKRQGGNYGGDGDRNRQGAESQNWRSEGNRSQQGHRDNWQDGRGQGKRGKRGRGGNRDRDDHHQGDRRQGQEHHQERRGQEQRQERRGQEEHQDQFQERRGKPRHNKDPALEKIQREQDHRGYVFFYQGGSPFSQWHPAFFEVDHVQYNCTEQFMMHQKAVLMGDHDSAEYILSLYEPRKQKEAGRNVYPWKQDLWDRHCYDIVKKGNYAKFSQNEELRDALLETHPKTLVETNPFDKIWGIGLTMDDPNAKFQASWKGRNYLGFILTEVRDQLMSEGYKVQGKSSKRIPGMPEPAKHEKKAAIPGGQGPRLQLYPLQTGKDWFDEESTSSTPAHGVSDLPHPIPKMTKCFISIITTSSDKDSSLLQLSVLSPAGRQNWYVKPSKPVSKQVEEVTGIKYDKGGQMYVSGRKVEALPPKQVLQGLLDFLGEEPAYLVGHNIKSHSCYVIIEAATPAGLNEGWSVT